MDKLGNFLPAKLMDNLKVGYSPTSTTTSNDSRQVQDSHNVAKSEANRYDQHYKATNSGNVVTSTDNSDNRFTFSPILIDNSHHTNIIGSTAQNSAGFSAAQINSELANQTKPQEPIAGNIHASENVVTPPHSETEESELKITDLKPVILISKMDSEMEDFATNYVAGAFFRFHDNKERARYICDAFDKQYEKSWHCVVGSDFTNYVTYEENLYIHLKIGNQRVLIFKTPFEAHVKQLQDSSKSEVNQLQESLADKIKQLNDAEISMQAYEKCHAIIKEYRTDIDRAYLLDVENLNVKHVELQSNAIKMFDEWNCMKEAGIVLKQRHDFIKTMTDEIFSIYDLRNKKERNKHENKPVWVPAYGGETPTGAVIGCKEGKFVCIVARVEHEGHILPGKYLPYYNYCCVPYNGGELKIHKYEVLCNTKVDWVKMNRNQQLPSNALPGGKTKGGEILYFGRTTHTGGQGYLGYGSSITMTILGKVDQYKMCCISHYGKEHKYPEYELLVIKEDG